MKLFVLSKENIPLAVAEAEQLHDAKASRLVHNLLFLDVEQVETGLAFTREIHDVIRVLPNSQLAALEELPWADVVVPPFLVRKEGTSSHAERDLAGHVWRGLAAAGKQPSVNLQNPRTLIHFFFLDEELIVAIRRWHNDERFFNRRAHLRPRNHPTSLNPKLARVMINLAGPPATIKTLLDPFCGSGGLLLEGALIGREVTGTDIDPEQMKRCEENLSAYGAAAVLSVGDATNCDRLGGFDAIVTDLPYGKNSQLSNAEETFRDFFKAAAQTTTRIVVAMDSSFPLKSCFAAQWRAIASFTWYVHHSLTKRVYLLERA